VSPSRASEGRVAEPGEAVASARGVLWSFGLPARAVLLGLLFLYRSLVSPLLGPRCRFHPSCSAYAEGAIRVHGAAKGVALAVWRILRCSPLTAGGIDAVPPRGGRRALGASGPYDGVIQSGPREG
jgi:uncharacterized protein